MQQPEKKDILFDSADGTTSVAGYFYTTPGARPHCVVQISHGMREYIARYETTAAWFAPRGVVVCGNDHLGHGSTAKAEADLGYFSGEGGRNYLLADMKTMNELAHRQYPGLPVVLLGHSMGSFFAREYATQHADTIDGLILSGTSGQNKLVDVGIALVNFIGLFKGQRARSKLIDNMAAGGYMKRIPNPATPHDWISRDTAVVEKYANDPKCTTGFTLNGYKEMFKTLKAVSSPAWAGKMPKDLPVMIMSGADDPVGAYGEGTAQVKGWLEEAGVETLVYKLYPGARHEMLNEVNKEEVYEDILGFIEQVCKAAAAATKT